MDSASRMVLHKADLTIFTRLPCTSWKKRLRMAQWYGFISHDRILANPREHVEGYDGLELYSLSVNAVADSLAKNAKEIVKVVEKRDVVAGCIEMHIWVPKELSELFIQDIDDRNYLLSVTSRSGGARVECKKIEKDDVEVEEIDSDSDELEDMEFEGDGTKISVYYDFAITDCFKKLVGDGKSTNDIIQSVAKAVECIASDVLRSLCCEKKIEYRVPPPFECFGFNCKGPFGNEIENLGKWNPSFR